MSEDKVILIDFGKISTPYCGLAEVALNFAAALKKLSPTGIRFVYIVPQALRAEFDHHLGKQSVITPNYQGLTKIIFYLTGQARVLCKLPHYDVYHYLHFYSPWGQSNKNFHKSLLTIHDFHALERKRAAKRLRNCLVKVNYLAFISNFAANEYSRLFPENKQHSKVIANGVKVPPQVNLNRSKKLVDKYDEFLFTLGGLKRKNIHSLLGMMQAISVSEDVLIKRLKLIVAGSIKEDYRKQLEQQIHDKDIQDRVIFLGSVDEQEKYEYLYACRAFVFPSLQEGFGIPIIEALHFGKPVFCSDKTSLPEVGGDFVTYWQHFEPDYMVKKLLEGLRQNDKDISDLSHRRKQYALSFNWDLNAQKYIELYRKILDND